MEAEIAMTKALATKGEGFAYRFLRNDLTWRRFLKMWIVFSG
jgi:hypothetical protein